MIRYKKEFKQLLQEAIKVGTVNKQLQRETMVGRLIAGNLPSYAPSHQTLNTKSPLMGRRIAFLGSSITAGAGALEDSFVDYLVATDGVIAIKEAVSGTTLAGNAPDSYVQRLYHRIPVTQPLDAFVCQLSTNDGRHDKAMGQVTGAQQRHGFDETTTLGAIETIVAYVQQHWAVPIVFFTCVRKHDANYGKLVQQLKVLQKKVALHDY